MAKIIVTIKHTIPLMDYGNTIIEATQEMDLQEGDSHNIPTSEAIHDIREALATAILPLVEAEVERYAVQLLKPMDRTPDTYMRGVSKVYQWFRLAYPEVAIPTMAKLAMPPVLVGLKD